MEVSANAELTSIPNIHLSRHAVTVQFVPRLVEGDAVSFVVHLEDAQVFLGSPSDQDVSKPSHHGHQLSVRRHFKALRVVLLGFLGILTIRCKSVRDAEIR